jgi:CBS domain containing-hemolysin-like protein
LLVTFENAGHSRVPVYRDSLDEPIGMVHIKDLLSYMGGEARRAMLVKSGAKKQNLTEIPHLGSVDMTLLLRDLKIMRTVLFVPPSMPIIDLLVKMQATRIHMAVVVDEYGGTDGLVSIEDLVETVVGDIEDEHDTPEDQLIIQQAENVYMVDARAPIEDLATTLGISFEDEEAFEDVDTVGGYVFSLIGRVPVRGELIPFNGSYEFEILEADPRRIKRVRAQKRPQKPVRRDVKADAKPIEKLAAEAEMSAHKKSVKSDD